MNGYKMDIIAMSFRHCNNGDPDLCGSVVTGDHGIICVHLYRIGFQQHGLKSNGLWFYGDCEEQG